MADRETQPSIDPSELLILSELAALRWGGWDVACLVRLVPRAAGDTNRMHSAHISRRLLEMERRGLVQRQDAWKPIVWQITEEGRKHV